MTDISKCNGTECPVKESCWRYTAPASEWQSYCAYDEDREGDEGCDDYIEDGGAG